MTEETNVAPTQTNLTVQDLTLTLQVIQVASSRGAFKADELTAIGGLYDRIFKFLEASGAIAKEQPAQPAAESTPTATVTESKPAAKAAAAKAKKAK
jgi:hypothetical protein